MSLQERSATERVQEARARYVARGVSTPALVVDRAEGGRLWDVDGREYIDFAGGIGCANLGHNLPAIVDAVGALVEVLFDSGIRTGADIVKALALGARAVLVGRPWVYGLALGGTDGVRHVLRGLLADLDLTTALSGHRSSADLTRDSLQRVR